MILTCGLEATNIQKYSPYISAKPNKQQLDLGFLNTLQVCGHLTTEHSIPKSSVFILSFPPSLLL